MENTNAELEAELANLRVLSVNQIPEDEQQEIRNMAQKCVHLKQIGDDLIHERKYEAAIEKYNEAIELYPESLVVPPCFYGNRAQGHLLMKNPEKAIEDADAGLENDSSWEKGYVRKAKAYK